MMKQEYDVIVVGARVAGSSLAYELSRRGFQVLLLDKSTFPSDVFSTHNFFGNSLAMLRKMGVLDRLLETGAPLYRRAVVQFEDVVIDGRFPKADGEADCLCIRRTDLDRILFEHASMQPNVAAMEGVRVTNVLRDGGRVTGVAGVTRSGEKKQFSARLVVGADGRRSTIRSLVQARCKMRVPTDFASYVGYFRNYRQDGDIHAELYKLRSNISIIFPTNDQLYVVGLMFPLEDEEWMQRFKANPERAMVELIKLEFAGTPLAERIGGAVLAGRVKGLHGYDNDWYEGMGEGWALVGDALSFKDPAVGQGMPDALYGANLLAGVLERFEDWNRHWADMGEEYQRLMDEKMMFHFQLACQFTKNYPFPPGQLALYRLIAARPEAASAFLGTYNKAVRPEEFEKMVIHLLTGTAAAP
jgi:2-polyprenyl-6-methoxyphenol hydroxylase-like FAD-dependent oxidoreductase